MSGSRGQAGAGMLEVDVVLEEEGWRSAVDADLESIATEAASAALQAVDLLKNPGLGGVMSIAVLLSSDARIAALNADFRGKPTPTNVLSWPSAEWSGPAGAEALAAALARSGGHLGDVALALGVMRREAEEESKTLEDHLRHLIVHGVLHLLGYDHETDEEAALMEARERAALAAINVADPYASDHVKPGGDG